MTVVSASFKLKTLKSNGSPSNGQIHLQTLSLFSAENACICIYSASVDIDSIDWCHLVAIATKVTMAVTRATGNCNLSSSQGARTVSVNGPAIGPATHRLYESRFTKVAHYWLWQSLEHSFGKSVRSQIQMILEFRSPGKKLAVWNYFISNRLVRVRSRTSSLGPPGVHAKTAELQHASFYDFLFEKGDYKFGNWCFYNAS